MKKIIVMGAMVALMFSCSENYETDKMEGQYTITANISMPKSDELTPKTRISTDDYDNIGDGAEWKFTWDEADKKNSVYAVSYYGDSQNVGSSDILTGNDDLKDGDVTATFTGTFSAASATRNYAMLYAPENGGIVLGHNTDGIPYLMMEDGKPKVDLTSQNGELNNTVMIGDHSSYPDKDITISPDLKHVGAFLVLNVEIYYGLDKWITDNVEINKIILEGGLNTKGVIDPTRYNVEDDEFLTDESKEAITVTLSEPVKISSKYVSFKTYLNILPTKLAYNKDKIIIKLCLSNGSEVTITKTMDQTVILERATINSTTAIFNLNDSSVTVE